MPSCLLSQSLPEYPHHSQVEFTPFHTLQTVTIGQMMADGKLHPFKPATLWGKKGNSVVPLCESFWWFPLTLDRKSQSLPTAGRVLCALASAYLCSPFSQQFGHKDFSILKCTKLPTTTWSLPMLFPLIETLSHHHTPFTWMTLILKCDSG